MNDIEQLLEESSNSLIACDDVVALENLRVHYMGKKGLFTERLKSLGKLSAEERPQAGQAINAAKKAFQQQLEARKTELEQVAIQLKLAAEKIDVTLPGRGLEPGGLHPVTITMRRIAKLFEGMGFEVAEDLPPIDISGLK
jgi:phenylalanyl-tRNA synthetase alpha chain